MFANVQGKEFLFANVWALPQVARHGCGSSQRTGTLLHGTPSPLRVQKAEMISTDCQLDRSLDHLAHKALNVSMRQLLNFYN